MPYDARPVSQGGNAGIDDQFTREAPEGKFRVVHVDTFDGSDGVLGDFNTFEEAKKAADEAGGEMSKSHVYDPQGHHVYEAGRW